MSLENIRAALERHAPSIEFVSDPEPPDPGRELRGPTVDDDFVVVSQMIGVGRHLEYRIMELYSGKFMVVGRSMEIEEPPQLILRDEPSWKTCAWFIWLMEMNRIRVAWRGDSITRLRDQHGKTALTIVKDTAPMFMREL